MLKNLVLEVVMAPKLYFFSFFLSAFWDSSIDNPLKVALRHADDRIGELEKNLRMLKKEADLWRENVERLRTLGQSCDSCSQHFLDPLQ